MKILFVSSGNSINFEIAPFIKAQGLDLIESGIDLQFFPIKGKGVFGYLSNIPKLRKKIKKEKYDLIHAHFVLSAWVSLLTFTKQKLIVSFMGSDTYGDVDINGKITLSSYLNIFLAKLIQPFVDHIIVKSKNLEDYVYLKRKCSTIPNGVNLSKFINLDYLLTRKELGFEKNKRYILFLADKRNDRKNYKMLEDAFSLIRNDEYIIINPFPISHELVIKYLNAADVLAFTSYLEGSPNLVKEAMACNLPIVSVNVGDTEWLLSNVSNSYVTNYNIQEFAKKLVVVLESNKRSNGRLILKQLGIDSYSVSDKLIKTYKNILYDIKTK